MKQALILCAGQAKRLRPLSHILPKASAPFLNLPLLAPSWLYLELMGVRRFVLNACLFPEKIKEAVSFLSGPGQSAFVSIEKQPLGAVGTLRHLKARLKKEESFFYINGDSLFFPSQPNRLKHFKEEFIRQKADVLFFSSPASTAQAKRPPSSKKAPPRSTAPPSFLWADKSLRLQYAGPPKARALLKPFYFSGLALFKSSLLDELPQTGGHLFLDLINPLARKKRFMLFEDKAFCFEAGDPLGLIQAQAFGLKSLFDPPDKLSQRALQARQILQKLFERFDPQDQTVGLKNGRLWSKKLGGQPLLAPANVKGLELLKLKGPSAIGPQAQLFGESLLDQAILGAGVSWRGPLAENIILTS